MSIRCRDTCGRSVEDEAAALQAGWSYLEITKAYRCGACDGALRAVRHIIGPDAVTPDNLPPDSLGAIKRETASGILPPVVKGTTS